MSETAEELLARLKNSVEATADDDRRAELTELVDKLERRLADDDDHDGVLDEAREAAVRFETDHPELSHTLRRIVDALSALGL